MIKNYLKIAWRNLFKHKVFSFINILGLAIGIAACIIIFLYVYNEMTFDRYNIKADRIARVTTTMHAPESDIVFATSPTPLATTLLRDYPEVEATVRLENAPQVLKLNNELLREEAFYKADQAVFSIFTFDFVEGTASDALTHPNAIVITEKIAKKYFPQQQSVVGETIICNEQAMRITGVVKDRPFNSDIKIDALLSVDYSSITSWMDDISSMYTFVLFHKKPDLSNFARQLSAMSTKYVQPELNASEAGSYSVKFDIQPLADVHFTQGKLLDTPKGNRQFSYIFSLLAAFILLIALLNYINLSTARSAERAKEVGIRKVSGAPRFQLIRQFLFESFFLITIAWLIGIAIVEVSLPFFNSLLQTKLNINWLHIMWFAGGIFLVTILLAGLYPAFVLSGFMPVKVLKGSWRHSGKGVVLRKTVTVTQFAITAGLIMGTLVIYMQMTFIRQKDLGFNKDQLMNIYLPTDSASMPAVHAFQNALRQRPEIRDITVGSGLVEGGMTLASTFVQSGGKKRELMCNYFCVDPRFLSVFQIDLSEGRNLSDEFGTDKNEGFLVNEAFLKTVGWKSGIGEEIEGFGHKGKIVGVVKNFYYKSMHNLIEPLVIVYNTNPVNTTTVKVSAASLPGIKNIFKKYFPAIPFDYAFFDDMVEQQYRQDKITMSLFNNFTLLAIFVSCLGLYGLVALIAVQRTKEISVRKVLGASLKQLLSLLAKDFVKLVFWALLISLPVAGFVMQQWLNSYAYHIRLTWCMFLIPAVLILLITLLVISKEVIKTALVNPVKSLRME